MIWGNSWKIYTEFSESQHDVVILTEAKCGHEIKQNLGNSYTGVVEGAHIILILLTCRLYRFYLLFPDSWVSVCWCYHAKLLLNWFSPLSITLACMSSEMWGEPFAKKIYEINKIEPSRKIGTVLAITTFHYSSVQVFRGIHFFKLGVFSGAA